MNSGNRCHIASQACYTPFYLRGRRGLCDLFIDYSPLLGSVDISISCDIERCSYYYQILQSSNLADRYPFEKITKETET